MRTFPFQVSNEAQQCLSVILSKYDPFRCLSVSFRFAFFTGWSNKVKWPVAILRLRSQKSTLLLFAQVVVPLLVSEDEKMLVTCINCLTKVILER